MVDFGGWPWMDEQWSKVTSAWPYSDRLLFCVCAWTAHSLAFWGWNLFYLILHKFDLFSKYKIHKDDRVFNKDNDKLIKDAIRKVLVTHFVLDPLTWYYLLYPGYKTFGMGVGTDPIPSPITIFIQFWIFMAMNDFLFYWSHRMLHLPYFYKRFHKLHHKFIRTYGIAAEYSHPFEAFLNAVATLGPPLVFGAHMVTNAIYLFFRIWETVDAHSGYAFPWSPWALVDSIQGGADKHDYHHSHNKGNYGIFAYLDWMMGTDKDYKEWKKKQRLQKNKSS